MEDFNQLMRELESMDISELSKYIMEKYPENQELWYGSKKILIRKVLNFERNQMNTRELAEQ